MSVKNKHNNFNERIIESFVYIFNSFKLPKKAEPKISEIAQNKKEIKSKISLGLATVRISEKSKDEIFKVLKKELPKDLVKYFSNQNNFYF